MVTKDKRDSISENNRKIFDYISQPSLDTDENVDNIVKKSKSTSMCNETQESVGEGNLPSKVLSHDEEVKTQLTPSVDNGRNINEIQYVKDEPKFTVNTGFTAPQISKIVSDYLDMAPSDFSTLIEPSSDAPKHEERYNFLIDVRDKNKIRRGEDGYDPTTLYIPSVWYNKFTPFEKQFWDIKKEHFDTVIFFKKGKFYELYEDDAVLASKLFDLKIADRVNMKMAGVPESSYEIWAAKFVAQGYSIGRVDQAENSMGKKLREQNGKKDKIINRELKEIVTVGTAYSGDCLDCCFPFYLAVIVRHRNIPSSSAIEIDGIRFSVLLYDASVNRVFMNSFDDTHDCSHIKTLFVQNDIRELITEENLSLGKKVITHKPDKTYVSNNKKDTFQIEEEYTCFAYLFNFMKSLRREDTLESVIISNLKDDGDFMNLDGSTLTNLDILSNNFDHSEDHTLFKAINYCITPFGQRLLRKWVVSPLKNPNMIQKRRRMAEVFSSCEKHWLVQNLREMGDIERYFGRLGGCNPTVKDLWLFVQSLQKAQSALTTLKSILPDEYQEINDVHLKNVTTILSEFKIAYEVSEEGVTPGNENDELFVLNHQLAKIEEKLQEFLVNLKQTTRFNDLCYKSIGKEIFQVETDSNHTMPSEFYVVSSTKAQRRYYSNGLKLIVGDYEECEERIFQSKGSVLRRAVAALIEFSFDVHHSFNYLASIDCIMSFSRFNSEVATAIPEFGQEIELIDFTNPIYPEYIRNTFKPDHSITLITGPNMGGKSTFLRSICMNIILAQIGMNVLCKSMKLPVFDQIFTRIGASDSLARGESTFMVEMNEASKILNQCTNRSFVIMDELGRGTSTKDGEAIAHAVLEYLKKIECICLFSTHYHKLVEEYDGVDKSNVRYKIDQEDITFLYKIESGVCTDSHGLYVARMAGIPEEIIKGAFDIRRDL